MLRKAGNNDIVIGVISDTHGLLRPEVFRAFEGVDLIAHAGDIDHPAILDALEGIAPVIAVRGNMDGGKWTRHIRPEEIFEAGGITIYMLHNPYHPDTDPKTAGFGVVISGHTHRPEIENKDGILYLNPGSAGPGRDDYPISVARLDIRDKTPTARIIKLVI